MPVTIRLLILTTSLHCLSSCAGDLVELKSALDTEEEWTDQMSKWSFTYTPRAYSPYNPESQALGTLYIHRLKALDVKSRQKIRWHPSGYFDIYESKYLNLVKEKCRHLAFLSEEPVPYGGGAYYPCERFIFMNPDMINNCMGVVGDDTIDFCKPFFDSLKTHITNNPDALLSDLFEKLPLSKAPEPSEERTGTVNYADKENRKQGLWIEYNPANGTLQRLTYKDGLPDGGFVEYHPNSELKKLTGTYIKGKRHGIWRYWNLSPYVLWKMEEYNYGVLVRSQVQ